MHCGVRYQLRSIIWWPVRRIGEGSKRALPLAHVRCDVIPCRDVLIRVNDEFMVSCKHAGAIGPEQLWFLTCLNAIFQINQLDMTVLIGIGFGLTHLHNAVLKMKHPSGMAICPDPISC